MLVVCCYCRRTIREEPAGPPDAVSHGMCAPCAAHFERLWDGITLSEYLDTMEHPALIVDGAGRLLAANRALAKRFRSKRHELSGVLLGDAIACERSRLPGGCGKTVHCRECTIRRSVESVAATGLPVARVPAYVRTEGGCLPLRVSARPRDGHVEVVLEEADAAGEPLAEDEGRSDAA